jgi:alkylation response protein AidB-like acyl-CoA dehydrogenase
MLTTEQREIQALAREFAEGELRPHTARWDETRRLDDAVFEKLAELGFLGMRVPERWGGLGLDWTTYLLVLEELSRGDAAVGLAVSVHNGPVAELLLAHGSDAQRERWLPRLASGELLGAFALSEPGAGSDPRSLETVAERTPGGWKLSGEKRFVTNGARAGLAAVFARSGHAAPGGSARGGVGCFLVELPAEGYRAGERETTMGLRASETVTVHLDGVALADDCVLGKPSEGLRYAMSSLDVGRAGVGAQAVGIARAAFEHATTYALGREQFSQPIADFGAIQEKLAEMAARIEGARALVLSAGALLEARAGGGGGAGAEAGERTAAARAAMAKLLASRTAMWVTDEAVQIFGGYGYMRDYPVEKLMRDAKGTEIYEGTSEILRVVIAREVLAAARAG